MNFCHYIAYHPLIAGAAAAIFLGAGTATANDSSNVTFLQFLGKTTAFAEQSVGEPYKVSSYSDEKYYKIGNCIIGLSGDETVRRVDILSTCDTEIKTLVHNWREDHRLGSTTIGDFVNYFGAPWEVSGCASRCGNTMDPVWSFSFESSRADGLNTYVAHIEIRSDKALEASAAVDRFLIDAGEEFVLELSDIEDPLLQTNLIDAVREVPITSLSIGGESVDSGSMLQFEVRQSFPNLIDLPAPPSQRELSSVNQQEAVSTMASSSELPRNVRKILECQADVVERVGDFPNYMESQFAGGASAISILKVEASMLRTDSKISSCQNRLYNLNNAMERGETNMSEQDHAASILAIQASDEAYQNALTVWALGKLLYEELDSDW